MWRYAKRSLSDLAFLVLSIGPSVLFGYLQLMALAQLMVTPAAVG